MATDTKILGMTIETTCHSELGLQRGAIEESQKVIKWMRFLASLGMTIKAGITIKKNRSNC